ncbi:MAG TPA: PEP-CTERM sorting domain-containing protein [Nitrospira sp.]|nr:PEP-CTERM sorting domain-containing protein [Nitrospira sp.]
MQYKRWIHALILGLPLLFVTSEAKAVTISIDPLQTFLFTYNDPDWGTGSVAGTTPIVLSDIGLSGGDLIQLEKLGDWYDGHAGYTGVDVAALDVMTEMVGVFSSSNELLAPDVLARVPGVLGAGAEYTTWNTLYSNMTTDVYGDFRIDNTFLYIPFGATHLFVAAHDIYYSDNSDPDGDYAVRITKIESVPEPSTLLLLISALLACGLFSKTRHALNRRV